ncbi:MAG: PTS system nitrogen regulatory IIA component [Gammaproteobacteria bacterium]|nr:MAG: PTS system nitrogen regulatory IIA component [Gammaproteobacteria bacterium]TND02944.1 MAG: PTS system, nitrogen regulatory IIA component [Gammaproteobacteria bacterium]
MTQLADSISPERIGCRLQANSKKRALESVAEMIASQQSGLLATEVFDSLIARERLGSTGIGHGIAIPHGRLPTLDTAVCAFMSLAQGVDFDAVDSQPVDLVMALLVPSESTEQHLQLLSQLAEMFSDEDLRRRLREARSQDDLYHLLTGWQPARPRRSAAT